MSGIVSIHTGGRNHSCPRFMQTFPRVVVDDFDLVGTVVTPDEAHAPLVVDAEAVLPGSLHRSIE
jgi:hypothetical protein